MRRFTLKAVLYKQRFLWEFRCIGLFSNTEIVCHIKDPSHSLGFPIYRDSCIGGSLSLGYCSVWFSISRGS